MVLDRDFWERGSKQVARDLVGRTLTYAPSTQVYDAIGGKTTLPHIQIYGVLTEVDAYDGPLEGRENSDYLFSQAPGTIGFFSSRRGPISVITAHAPSRKGLITLRQLIRENEEHGPLLISKLIGIERFTGQTIGPDSSLYLGESGILANRDFVVVNEMLTNSPVNRTAYFRLKRKIA